MIIWVDFTWLSVAYLEHLAAFSWSRSTSKSSISLLPLLCRTWSSSLMPFAGSWCSFREFWFQLGAFPDPSKRWWNFGYAPGSDLWGCQIWPCNFLSAHSDPPQYHWFCRIWSSLHWLLWSSKSNPCPSSLCISLLKHPCEPDVQPICPCNLFRGPYTRQPQFWSLYAPHCLRQNRLAFQPTSH